MSRIWSMMDIGRRSLVNSQTGLQTVSHNVANKSTEGYSRQRVNFQSAIPVGHGKKRVGMGARAGNIDRINNAYLEKQIEKEGNNLGYLKARSESVGRVEQVYNEQINKGLNKYIGEFFNSFRELSNNPESLAARTLVKESAEFLSRDFQRVDKQLTEIKRDMDYQIATNVAEINQITEEIANLNEKVQQVVLAGGPANDERDRRDLLVKQLSEKVNIRWAESDTGLLTITAGDSAVIVSGYSHRQLFTSPVTNEDGKRLGHFDIYYKPTESGTPVNVTEQFRSGELGGLIEVRDKLISGLQTELDDLAYGISKNVNEAHQYGFDRYNQKGGAFFNPMATNKDASRNIRVSEGVRTDVGLIAAAASPNAPGDNRIANILSSLQDKKIMSGGTATFGDYYSTIVGEVGIAANRANSASKAQSDIIKQLNNIREQISGVSLDEETTKMIEYQKSFDASARLIRTADEMLDTVLSLKRL